MPFAIFARSVAITKKVCSERGGGGDSRKLGGQSLQIRSTTREVRKGPWNLSC